MVDGKLVQQIYTNGEGSPIVAASISDPYIAIKRADGSCAFFVGDSVARKVSEAEFPQTVCLL
jgi:cleavage and polyadenylation specificity factor subunit 1